MSFEHQIRKAVITAAGLGTRLLPLTKEMPKEMLPLFSILGDRIALKPVIQIIFETLYEAKFREFCFIVGRGKRAIEDYFTPDSNFLQLLAARKLHTEAESLKKFYEMIFDSKIFFVNQPEPKGFGHAVLYAEPIVGSEPFLLHAGDDVILSENSIHILRLIEAFQEYDADCVMLVEEVENPRFYGVIQGDPVDKAKSVFSVTEIVEKPEKPPTNLAVVAIYVFKPKIFEYLKKVSPDRSGEIQLTDAIRLMIKDGGKVYAVKLRRSEKRIDVGMPERYWLSLMESYRYANKKLGGKKS